MKVPTVKPPAVEPPANLQSAPPSNVAARRAAVIIGVLLAVALITTATLSLIANSLAGTRHEASASATGVTVATFATLPGDKAYPAGIVRAADGTFYVSALGSGAIYKASADGKLTPLTLSGTGLTAPAAIALSPDGSLYVADFTSTDPQTSGGTIKRMTPAGSLSVYATTQKQYFLSHMAFDAQSNLYITFPGVGEVWRYTTNGTGTLWLKLDPVGQTAGQPTGIVYDKAANAFVIGDAGTGTLYRVAVKADGSADRPVIVYEQGGLEIQAVTSDEKGRLLFSAWVHDNGQLARVDADGKHYVLLAQSFRAPLDVLAADGKIYVVNSDLQGLFPRLSAHPPFTIDVVNVPPTL